MTSTSTIEKRKIVKEIIDKVQTKGGRFLKLDGESENWYSISTDEAERKTGAYTQIDMMI